jgi:hypothetical protein
MNSEINKSHGFSNAPYTRGMRKTKTKMSWGTDNGSHSLRAKSPEVGYEAVISSPMGSWTVQSRGCKIVGKLKTAWVTLAIAVETADGIRLCSENVEYMIVAQKFLGFNRKNTRNGTHCQRVAMTKVATRDQVQRVVMSESRPDINPLLPERKLAAIRKLGRKVKNEARSRDQRSPRSNALRGGAVFEV